jgi:hypothetical protein
VDESEHFGKVFSDGVVEVGDVVQELFAHFVQGVFRPVVEPVQGAAVN